MSLLNLAQDAYWNQTDCDINARLVHTRPVFSRRRLLQYYQSEGITNVGRLAGLRRYLLENNGKPLASTLQGSVFSGIDTVTGRRVIIKQANKYLVERNICKGGQNVGENIEKEARLLWRVSGLSSDGSKSQSKSKSRSNSISVDAGFSKFVDFFHTDDSYFVVSEYGGIELLSYVKSVHPFQEGREHPGLTDAWKEYVRYHFRFIARSVYYLHEHCRVAHLDLSLENTVIDDKICRIIDFGLAQQCPHGQSGDTWLYDGYVGKRLYQSPEIRNLRKIFLEWQNQSQSQGTLKIPKSGMYNPFAADVWALGVMLFILLVGSQPWHVAEASDGAFNCIINGKMALVLEKWKCQQYVDRAAFDLLEKIFVCEGKRIDMKGVLNHDFVKNAARSLGEAPRGHQTQTQTQTQKQTKESKQASNSGGNSNVSSDDSGRMSSDSMSMRSKGLDSDGTANGSLSLTTKSRSF